MIASSFCLPSFLPSLLSSSVCCQYACRRRQVSDELLHLNIFGAKSEFASSSSSARASEGSQRKAEELNLKRAEEGESLSIASSSASGRAPGDRPCNNMLAGTDHRRMTLLDSV